MSSLVSPQTSAAIKKHHDGKNGYLIPSEAVEQMAEVLALLLGDDQLRNRMGDEDRRIALETFTPGRMMKSLIQIYEAATYKRKL